MMAYGSAFADEGNPQPMVMVGQGETGYCSAAEPHIYLQGRTS